MREDTLDISTEDLSYAVDHITAYEDGCLPDEDVMPFFERLVRTGLIWHLQGSYQRTAHRLGLI